MIVHCSGSSTFMLLHKIFISVLKAKHYKAVSLYISDYFMQGHERAATRTSELKSQHSDFLEF